MNEIEKMYKNAEIKQLPTCNNCNMLVEYWSNGTYCSTCRDDKDNDECGMADYTYPPFTAEKQLSLMAFLINRKVGLSFKAEQGEITVEAISRGLAGIVNRIWQSLSPGEKQQVKGILE